MRILLFSSLFLIPFYSIFFGHDVVMVSVKCLQDEKSLLLQVRENLNFNDAKSTKLVTWDKSLDCCSWGGVTCNDNTGHVIDLDLSNESIFGGIDISSSLSHLQYLEYLNLAYNKFNNGVIPSGFDKLTSLTYLNLSNANFSGQIPIEISRMTTLVTLDLSTLDVLRIRSLKLENPNLLMLVQNLKELTGLYLDGVNISAQGNVWCEALSSSLPKLQVLSLSSCYLSGPIESSLVKLQSLSVIRLDNNNLSAPVPDFFANFTNLTFLHLSSSGLNGAFPKGILQVKTLETLDLSNNGLLQGSLPDFPLNGSLQTLVLSNTNFSGELPYSIRNLKNLSRIELVRCNFSGSIPNSIASLTQLVYVDFSFNTLIGPIPSFSSSKNLTQLLLAHNLLNGSILHINWEGLSNLVNLDLRNNSLSGNIPPSLFKIPSLQKIQLSHNQFTGGVNELNLSSDLLDTLDLSSNKLEVPFPTSVFSLRGLKILSLSSNHFNGTLELNMIQHLKNLSSLDLSYNSLAIDVNGTNSTSSFPQLTSLKLASCKLRIFPDFLRNQTRLTHLDLSDNQIHGLIPNWIWRPNLFYLNISSNSLVELEGPMLNLSSNLSILDLHSNKLRGHIPILPPNATYLDYSWNNFSSVIPTAIGSNLSLTIFFSLSSNNFSGKIPESICNAMYLRVLDLSNNSLSGMIPRCLTNITGTLGVLNLQKNKLTGSIVNTFPSICGLKTLDLNGNHFGGQIPNSLGNCKELEVLDLGNNKMDDTFPCWLRNVSSLRVLVLRSNNFHGFIKCTDSNSTWEMLQIVDLANNNFSGKLPSYSLGKAMKEGEDEAQSKLNHLRFEFLGLSKLYYQDAVTVTIKGFEMELVKILTVFTSIDLACNNFQGEIPEVLGDFKALYVLNLSHNALTGQIPSVVGNLRQLESLDLSQNNLSGTIPTQLANLNFLSVLNLSFNQLEGMIPRGNQIQTFSNTSFQGNEGLCGLPLNSACPNSDRTPPAIQRAEDPALNPTTEFDWQFIMTGWGFGVGAGIIVGLLVFSEKGRIWYDEFTDRILMMILPALGLVYTGWKNGKVEAEEIIEEELTGSTEDEEDDEKDEMDSNEFGGQFCVFCSKLDINRKRAIHNPNCTCHHSPPISSSSSTSSSSSEAHIMGA